MPLILSFSFMQYVNGQNTMLYTHEKAFKEQIENSALQLLASKSFKPIQEIAGEAKLLKNNMPVAEKINLPKSTDHKKLAGEELFNKCKQGVLVVGMCYSCGNCNKTHMAPIATAFAITSDGVCVTNYHVLEELIEKSGESLAKDSLYFVSTIAGKIYALDKILAYSKEGDAAIFRVAISNDKLDPVPLGTAAQEGNFVCAITHPDGKFYYYSQGAVARNISGETAQDDRMQITADYAVGSSGGPIINQSGQLVGLVSSTESIYADKQLKRSLQMVVKETIPVSTIKKLLDK
ncbi:S1C family serine protease [Chitinophaga sp. OAE865]|uniref:S1 family peptidase n=1 Tax=Chitinophaga sp. OAE865 TaxID=2817898 RepID=UPI001AE24058